MNWEGIESSITLTTQEYFKVAQQTSVGGGSINRSYAISNGDRQYFVKLNEKKFVDMFSAEAEGLFELANTKTIQVPTPICWGESSSHAYIVMEYISLSGGRQASSQQLGENLAKLHQVTADKFGWHRDNTIGTTPQINQHCDSWLVFYREYRLRYQLNLANQNGAGGELKTLGELLRDSLNLFFSSYQPVSSLLHGDFWSGNYAYNEHAEPVIFDPAVYYGDREADIAMTELFGGFPEAFYQAYHDAYPLDEGYQVRKILYNLYHVLNHLNLFGGGYQQQAIGMMKRLLSEVR